MNNTIIADNTIKAIVDELDLVLEKAHNKAFNHTTRTLYMGEASGITSVLHRLGYGELARDVQMKWVLYEDDLSREV